MIINSDNDINRELEVGEDKAGRGMREEEEEKEKEEGGLWLRLDLMVDLIAEKDALFANRLHDEAITTQYD
ncbi:hypothetical protein TorRG33x02_130190 [Trema orientale]|uniref:Uncharacterized protein n=1 Tax=Trema orientale TaxID=63057 RepID=A0A2P5F094_TREOI|nr:hypothetical protein TorRG33x02_130190 [Trema orientale]